MYYKIENKESEVYKKLHDLRTKELQIEIKNTASIIEKTGLEFKSYYGRSGQQNFRRVTSYSGFEFTHPDKVCLKTWKRHKEHNEIFVPNTRTKLGREMQEFLNNGLEGSRYDIVIEILKLPELRKFTFPFVEIINDNLIVLALGEGHEPKDENVIEITSKEFKDLTK